MEALSQIVSLSRFDANSDSITSENVQFKMTIPNLDSGYSVFRYPDTSSDGIGLQAEGGSFGACASPSSTCILVTSPRTSSFGLFRVGSSSSPSPSSSPGSTNTDNYWWIGLVAGLPGGVILGLTLAKASQAVLDSTNENPQYPTVPHRSAWGC